MKIVILAFENDNHTAPIKWALEKAGYAVVCWAGLSWPAERQASILLNEDLRLTLGPHTVDPGDVVWIRRANPAVHNPDVAGPDMNFAKEEYRWFSLSVMYSLETLPVRCINPYSASRFINNKAVQLPLARQSGLNVPRTLLSNSPSAVRDFFDRTQQRLVCKSFFPHIWKKAESEALAVTETFELEASELPVDEVLTYAPAIYQEMIVKSFDVRMVLLGAAVYSYSLHNVKGALDWRQDATQGLVGVEIVDTPAEVEAAVLRFAQKAGIVFGSLDFAIDSAGKWWFLEVNEEGQFLWLDEFNPEVRIQEKFLAFLTLPAGVGRHEIEAAQTHFASWDEYWKTAVQEQVMPEEHIGAPVLSIEP